MRKGRVINAEKKPTIGSKVKLIITKNDNITKNELKDVIIIQTKKPIMRLDGSTLTFGMNSAVTVNLKKKSFHLGFK